MAQIFPSDSYVRFLSPPAPKPAPEHIKDILLDYKITQVLGSGGFAKVYKAIGPFGKEVALKIPKTDDIMATMDMDVINRFKSEAELWMRLEHTNIVTLHSGKTQPLPHMAMELMEGGNLKQLMKNHNLTIGEAVHIMEQVLKGLSFAHRMASVHRDLKPENILFTADGVAKITDWGIGKFMASAGKSQSVGIKGTLDYCAPEQYNKRQYGKVDWQTDIFQVGVMFYEMLTGENPFAGEDFADCMGKVLMFEPEPPSTLNPEAPKEMDEVIMKAIAKKKEDRWDSGAVMLSKLKDAISGKVSIGPKCSECGNVIALENKKLRCKNCKKFFCETCEGWIDKVSGYRGYKTKIGYPLCEDCYDEAVDARKRRTDAFIKKKKSKGWWKEGNDWINSIGMKFKKIPGKSYYIGKYTVTQKEWKAVMGASPWKDNICIREGDDYPATYISWNDCLGFVRKLNSKEGHNKYRFPTEEEWLYACRAGSTTKYCFGDEASRLGEYAWYNKNAWDLEEKYAHRVGQKKPNQWGLYDIHGNVVEWTSTKAKAFYRVHRGGNWFGGAHECGFTWRSWRDPGVRRYGLGVRIVRSSD